MNRRAAVDWDAIDTVLLDMDGTLLDLRFDNWFWQELIPVRYAVRHGITADAAARLLAPKFRAAVGTIDWYCIEHWSRELGLDIGAIKHEARAEVRYLPGALEFLGALRGLGKRRVLVTNAHPQTLAIKNLTVDIERHVDASYTAHPFTVPKEHPGFWARLREHEPFEPQRTLFVDDNVDVLESARGYGIRHLRAIRRPDSGRPPKDTRDFIAVDRLADLIGEAGSA